MVRPDPRAFLSEVTARLRRQPPAALACFRCALGPPRTATATKLRLRMATPAQDALASCGWIRVIRPRSRPGLPPLCRHSDSRPLRLGTSVALNVQSLGRVLL